MLQGIRNKRLYLFTLLALLGAGPLPAARGAAEPSKTRPGWLEAATEEIRRSEYRFSETAGGGSWTAPNRAQGLRSRISGSGIELTSRTEGAAGWTLTLSLGSFGRAGGARGAARDGAPERLGDGDRVEIRRDGITEWYVNDERGLEQGFLLDAPPRGDDGQGPLVLEIGVGGDLLPRLDENRDAILFADGSGEEVLGYSKLLVTDDTGKILPSRLRLNAGRIAIVVDDAGAVSPITVDPLLASPAWIVAGNSMDRLGDAVATAGDVNGDGYSDVIVGVPGYDGGVSNEGAAFVYLGSSSGPSTTPAWFAHGGNADSGFGSSVAPAGDVDADGFGDVIVGAPLYDDGQADEGAAFLWLGSAAGLGATGTPANADWSYQPNQADAHFGWSVAGAGDVDGDGDDDVLVGAPELDAGQLNEGRVYLFLGVGSGLAISPAWLAESNQSCVTVPGCGGPDFGAVVGTAGDVNGDGFADLLIGAPEYDDGTGRVGRVFVWHGGAALPSGPDGTPANASWWADGDTDLEEFGSSAATAGDIDGDGFAEIIVGSPQRTVTQISEGMAFVWFGSPSGLGPVGSAANADWTARPDFFGAQLGTSLSTAGDVNGDGFADVIAGAFGYTDGAAFVWLGSASGLGANGTPANADWSASGSPGTIGFGLAVAAAGDVNGDGFGDVIVGDATFDAAMSSENGAAYIFYGGAEAPAASAAWFVSGSQNDAQFGFSVASAGDVNGDGFGDVIVGVPLFDGAFANEGRAFLYLGSSSGLFFTPGWIASGGNLNANLGSAAGSAGDVNGDGYGDVVIGSPGYGKSGAGAGQVLVWHGGPPSGGDPSGMGPDGTPLNADWKFDGIAIGEQMGGAAAAAGDVNGDGYGDIIAGAPFYSGPELNEGRAMIFTGSASGLSAVPAWTYESDSPSARFGTSVAAAGDVDGDRFGDVLVGAPWYDGTQSDEGRLYLFAGDPVMMTNSPAWLVPGGTAGARFAHAVSSAGDVDGDGYSDVIVGAPGYSLGLANQGAASLFLGGPFGTVPFASWYVLGTNSSMFLGQSVSAAGDVNADGYGDVLVGGPGYTNGQGNEGIAALWLGGPSGPGTPPGTLAGAAWSVESNQTTAYLGFDVAGAGDVNGDGFADIIAGASLFDGAGTDDGRAFVWYGAGGDNPHLAPRQMRSDDSAPVGPLGRSDSDTSMRLRVSARTAAGRGRVRLQWEVKPLGAPFDGTGIGESALSSDTGTPDFMNGSAIEIGELVAGLSPGTMYHWRARAAGSSPFFPWTHWLSPAHNTRTETDLRTPGCLDLDGDGYGAAGDPACPGGPAIDCDDTEAAVHPLHPELCDGLDNDCNGVTDENNPEGGGSCHTGLPGPCSVGEDVCTGGSLQCTQTVFPSPEICNRLDDDCDGFLPAEEVDADADGLATCEGDCNDADTGSFAPPQPVTGLDVDYVGNGGMRITWDSQDAAAGAGIVFDVFHGMASPLIGTGDFSTGRCLAEDTGANETYDYYTPYPPAGEALYFMLRGQNTCPGNGTGTYGSKEKDQTAAASSSPCM